MQKSFMKMCSFQGLDLQTHVVYLTFFHHIVQCFIMMKIVSSILTFVLYNCKYLYFTSLVHYISQQYFSVLEMSLTMLTWGEFTSKLSFSSKDGKLSQWYSGQLWQMCCVDPAIQSINNTHFRHILKQFVLPQILKYFQC